MATKPEQRMPDVKMDGQALYREEIYTDRKVGTIRQLVPVKSDGTADAGRPVLFIGEAQILTAAGPLPINFDIPAQSLADAVAKFGDAAKLAVERTVQELQELRRQQSSSIVIPQGGAGPFGPGGMPPGALPGGGKIKL